MSHYSTAGVFICIATGQPGILPPTPSLPDPKKTQPRMEVALSLSQESPEVAITMLTPPHEVGVSHK